MRGFTYQREKRKLQKENKAATKTQKFKRWKPYYAWHRVWFGRYCYAWFEWVERRGYFDETHCWRWQYRPKPAEHS